MLLVKRSFSRSLRPNFEFHVSMKFEHRSSFALGDLRRGSGIFSKVTFLKSVHSKEKDEACLGVVVKFFTKSLHRGGVMNV